LIRFLTPQLRVETVLELGPDRLRAMGLDALLLDVDGTLKRYRRQRPAPAVAAWIESLRTAGFKLCLLSNGRGRRIGQFARQVEIPAVCRACKPLPYGCRRAMRMLGAAANRTAIIGDQVFADVMAGRLAGVFTILVRPIHPEEEPWFTRLKRPLESRFLRWLAQREAGGAQKSIFLRSPFGVRHWTFR